MQDTVVSQLFLLLKVLIVFNHILLVIVDFLLLNGLCQFMTTGKDLFLKDGKDTRVHDSLNEEICLSPLDIKLKSYACKILLYM